MEVKPVVLIKSIQERLRKGYNAGANSSLNDRVRNLNALLQAIKSNTQQMQDAVLADLGRSGFMTILTEIEGLEDSVAYFKKHLPKLMADIPKDIPGFMAPASGYLTPEPYGVSLIMGSWNFPFVTTLNPLINAIAAGNVAVIKPSEMAPRSSAVMKTIIDSLDNRVFACIEGGPETAIGLLEERWDLIVFTGSPEKGKLIAAAAAKYLTPIVLELGGKNPVIVDKDVNMDNAVKRIVQGRYINAGQLCISPDMALVHTSRLDEFLNGVKQTITQFFGEDPSRSRDYSRIVNEMHTKRIAKLLEKHGGQVICGGKVDFENRYIAPTVVLNPDKSSPLGSQEVFGPILVVFTFENFDECIELINSREKPLALYYFGGSRQNMDKLKTRTSSGNLTWNDCVFHAACCDLPFGGVGNSGMAATSGVEGFRAMSHSKSILERGTNNSYPGSMRFPPYTEASQKGFLRVKHFLSFTQNSAKCTLKTAALIALLAFAYNRGYLDPVISQVTHGIQSLLSLVKRT